MDAFSFIQRIEGAGFTVALTHGNLAISPASSLTDARRAWIKAHKDELVAALAPANGRVLIHVPELKLSTGQRISCDMTVPRANMEKLRAVVKFRLKDDQGGGSVLGSPGTPREELVADLHTRYGKRLASIDGAEVMA